MNILTSVPEVFSSRHGICVEDSILRVKDKTSK